MTRKSTEFGGVSLGDYALVMAARVTCLSIPGHLLFHGVRV